MADDRILDRWMALETRGLHEGLVVKKRSLDDLLQEEAPQTTTREGSIHSFDRDALLRLAEVTSEEERRRLRLPITLRFHFDRGDAWSLEDEVAATVLRRLEGFGKAYLYREGRAWLPYSLGLELVLKYPTVIQPLVVP